MILNHYLKLMNQAAALLNIC